MKKLLILAGVFLFGYTARVLPFETYNIKANAGGEVVKTCKNLEAKNIKNRLIVKLDDNQERIELNNTISQINILTEEIKNQKEIVKLKKDTYNRYKKLSTKSKDEKNMKYYDFIGAENQLLALKSNLSNLISQKNKLLDIINRKNIKFSGYLSEITVSKDGYAAPGMIIAKGFDISKEKLYIYVPVDNTENINNKKVYINNKISKFKIYKIWKTPDSKYITSYKVELTGRGLKFGNVVNVSFH